MNRRASNSLPQTNRIIESKSVEVDRFFSFWSIVVITVNNVNSPFFLCWLYLSFTFRWKSILWREEKKIAKWLFSYSQSFTAVSQSKSIRIQEDEKKFFSTLTINESTPTTGEFWRIFCCWALSLSIYHEKWKFQHRISPSISLKFG